MSHTSATGTSLEQNASTDLLNSKVDPEVHLTQLLR